MRWIDSVICNQLPPNGVYNGMIPCANSQTTNAGVLCPTRLSSTRSIRNGGGSAGRLTRTVNPSCHNQWDYCRTGCVVVSNMRYSGFLTTETLLSSRERRI